ncbi:efflux RND transporter periplasmic adaptor subunit [Thermodesulfatator autotrophicus]|uniref:RND efflux pump membrane fusion protein barrel-sandwich domain-containing protein n=1 Tax=Thermodesulfatator autotrophicus TaxID=1795632 RepID=A0A177E9A6_9BACT|nr:efflux RND transporter periplasmic adaptor subunit [Thermodesulfatator autotrophicus]OAG27792.1 hypothetical protein TH606_04960 [Thermodesulfatator autotrophicus]
MKKHKILQCLLVVFVLVAGFLLAHHFISTKPKVPKRKPKPFLPLVEVLSLKQQDFQVTIEGFGTVRALRAGHIVPEVSGRLIYVSPKLVPGGRFKKGEILARIDPSDYEATLALAQAELEETRRTYEEIKAQALAAKEEWYKVLGHKETPPPLVVKKPQLAAAEARIKAAQAKYEKARLDLKRTTIRAPFDGLVTEAQVELGQYVSKGALLAKVYDIKSLEVAIPLSLEEIKFLEIPGFNSKRASKAKIFLHNFSNFFWTGEVIRASARADEKTRLIDIYVRINKPFSQKIRLLPGFFVKAEFEGKILKNVIVIPRKALYFEEGKWYVWLVEEGHLKRREIEIILFNEDKAVIRHGVLKAGENLVITKLTRPVPGMKVRIKP